MKAELAQATDMDFIRFFKIPNAPDRWWEGQCYKEGPLVKALAGVLEGVDGRYYGFMELRGTARFPFIFRRVLRFLRRVSEEQRIDKILAVCDDRYPNAQEFLERLGFTPTDETIEHRKVWQWQR